MELLINDLPRFLILLIVPFVLFASAFYLDTKNIENWIKRKYVHIIGLVVAGLYGAFIESLTEILLLVGALVIGVLLFSLPPIRFLQRITKLGTREGESQLLLLINAISTGFGAVILIVLFFDAKWVFLASLYSVALGDGMGEFIGRPFGKHQYTIFSQKSIEGSLGVFAGSIAGGVFSLLLFGVFSPELFVAVLIASFVVTIIEAFSFVFIDNILMQISYAGVLWFLVIR